MSFLGRAAAMRCWVWGGLAAVAFSTTSGAGAFTLREAIATTIDSNPQIGAAVENREAIEFELRQARGLYMPRVDAETSAGVRHLDRPRNSVDPFTGSRDQGQFSPVEVGIVGTWKLFDGFTTDAEVERQASRVDGASYRILERSEFLALEVSREYFDILLQERLVGLADQNVGYLRDTVQRIRGNVSSGSLTDADLKQGEERVIAARARVIEARQNLAEAKVRLQRLVGKTFARGSMPPSMVTRLPKSVEGGLALAVRNNPRIQIATADIDAAHALVKKARGKMMPEVFVEGRARAGRDIDGVTGRTNDLQARAVMRMNLYNGGIDQASIQEQTRRVAEAQFNRDQILREVRESVKLSFQRRQSQSELSGVLGQQASVSDRLVVAYADQFQVGRRSLLDLLDAQNTRYNAKVLHETAQMAARFAEYRILASTGQLVSAFGLRPPKQAEAYARSEAVVPPTADAETLPRYSPNRGRLTAPAPAL
ncbi:Type I secretion outer membrane protein, TolC family precursor [Bosea sp. LC85]|nr:Type I secretion outer membrane protein, TolC family precursor [Bosea sp. LC85]